MRKVKLITIAAAALSLASCATVLTPQRCEGALAAATTAEQVIAVLVNAGIEAEKAQAIAAAIMVGKLAIAAACATAAAQTAVAIRSDHPAVPVI